MALLALLATAPSGERTRNWLEDRLWSSRAPQQAKGSLRRELANLRQLLAVGGESAIAADRDRVSLQLDRFSIDIREAGDPDVTGTLLARSQFLEGLDIPGEEGFEDWLRNERARFGTLPTGPATLRPLPKNVLDLSKPPAGFGGRAAIAVLPFANATVDRALDIWAEGLAEDLIDRLSRLRWLPVIAMGSASELAALQLTSSAAAAMVGASYVVRGQLVIRTGVPALQISLFDTRRSRLLWSEQRPVGDVAATGQVGVLAREIVARLDAHVDTAEQTELINRSLDGLDVDEMVWRARWHLWRLSRDDAAIADRLLAEALLQRPNSAEVLIQAAYAKAWSIWSRRDGTEKIAVLRAIALRAVAADRFDGRGYLLVGMAEMWMRNHGRAKGLIGDAIRLNPSLARAYAQLGSCHYLSNVPAAAFEPLEMALRLSPVDGQTFYVLGEIAVSHFMLGNYDRALDYTDLSLARRPGYALAHTIRVNSLVKLGRVSEARLARSELSAVRPHFTSAELDWLPFADSAWNAMLKSGLLTAESAES
ncbi:hypothetical protein [Sphingomonas sp. SUN039]|uniref:hypothetical protein n=1 Tax=Sphingomonas sp. SUN039 TaxID=2937787 RepID=UPI002164D8A3|nr:hypothetical protein [Sphingomonas sp. SUN039]UVO54918.1 hypothetical protein M0209_12585 [Sphingomonas sp. SUN039]